MSSLAPQNVGHVYSIVYNLPNARGLKQEFFGLHKFPALLQNVGQVVHGLVVPGVESEMNGVP